MPLRDHPKDEALRWDCHAHPFGEAGQYPVSPVASYTLPPQPYAEYRQQLAAAGLNRSVLVQASLYGGDNAALLDRLRLDIGQGNRAIIAPPSQLGEREVEDLHALGVRGVRLNLLSSGGNGIDSVLPLVGMLRSAGWHIAVHLDATVPGLLDELVRVLDVPLVLDHMGRPPRGSVTPGLAPFQSLLRQTGQGKVFVKLSAPYQLSNEGANHYNDLTPLATGLLRANPQQILFGTNWPHIGQAVTPGDASALLNTTKHWLDLANVEPDQILEVNPLALFR